MEQIVLAAIILIGSFIVERRKAKAKAAEEEAKRLREQKNMEEWEAGRRAEEGDDAPTYAEPTPPLATPDPWEQMVLRKREEEERRAAEEARLRAEAEAERKRMEAEAARRRAKAAKPRRRAATFLSGEEGARVTAGSPIETAAGDDIGRLTPDDLRRAVILDAIFKRPEF